METKPSPKLTTRRRIAVPIAILLAATSVPMLTGCFANPLTGHGSLPSSFPASVPTYNGKIDTAFAIGSGKKKVWNVSVQIPGTRALDKIKSQLRDAGYKVVGGGTATHPGFGVGATSTKYGVAVVLVKASTQWVADYTVTSRSMVDQLHLH